MVSLWCGFGRREGVEAMRERLLRDSSEEPSEKIFSRARQTRKKNLFNPQTPARSSGLLLL